MPKKRKKSTAPDSNRQVGPFMKFKPTRDDIEFVPNPDAAKNDPTQAWRTEVNAKATEMLGDGWTHAHLKDDETKQKFEVWEKGGLRMVLCLQPRQPVRLILMGSDDDDDPEPVPEIVVERLDQGKWVPAGKVE